ncbi:methylmalonyl-CoA mutase family protein [Amycolatopsis suaedae]|uniref:Methylmalonyl-CoA mutase n=1 Tax=Amycolatopsis suaedae TaxID=2510978 RepID=A0A4Q7J5C2_9PSEU|nr:methylmalonyl-CoA mutase family protein [Amycolatopsis suaedae]RZQ62781.1 methylmalonyl-CoA mutase [Amycolatopsis suaedae]
MTTTSLPEEPGELVLGGEFDAPSRQRWQELVAGVLRKSGALPEDFGGDPDSLLTSRTYDGIELRPLYTADDQAPPAGFPGLPPFVRGTRPEGALVTGWDLRQLHADPDPAAANRAILADLEGGAGSVWLRTGTGGVPIAALPDVLAGVYAELAPVVLDAGEEYAAAADALLAVFADRDVPDSAVTGNVGADPIGLRARTGQPHDVAPAAELAARLAGRHPNLTTLVADGLPYAEAGGADSQELGAAVATGVAYLRALTAAGLDVATAARQLEFRLAAGADQFLTIAKLRAARRLWARVTEVCGVPPEQRGMRQHAVTSPAMYTRRDPWVNMLRATIACFGAAVGGADAITVLPFDHAVGLPDAFARRIARNTSAILGEESRLGGVIDPAGGSWYVERLTDELAHAAWREFTAIEAEGGIESTLDSGALAGRLERTWAGRAKRIAKRADAITGVSEFPNLTEKRIERPAMSTVDGGLPRRRYAEAFEALRDAADAAQARPRVFLATLGPVAAHTARATFAANLLAAGGIEAINPGATDDLPAALRESGATVACLCGTDRDYDERAAEVATRLREAGATTVLIAGKPRDGVDGALYAGCDALAVLTELHATLGVTA